MFRKTIAPLAIPCALALSVAGLAGATMAQTTTKGGTIKHATEAEAKTPQAAVAKMCQGCHNMEMVTDTPKTYDEWTESVHSMMDRGAVGTPAEVALVMQYLHENMTAIDVNHATPEDLHIILDAPDDAVKAIVARRKERPFKDMADLKTIPGIDAAFVDAKQRMIYFQ
jgi:DNA uptake protein ComE-like DNA-binding protein